MKQQQFNGPVEQVAGGNIYNQLAPHAVCPRCARGFMTVAQRICAPCEREVSRRRLSEELFRQIGLFFVMWMFFYSWVHGHGLAGWFFSLLSAVMAALATKVVVWTAEVLDAWVKGN